MISDWLRNENIKRILGRTNEINDMKTESQRRQQIVLKGGENKAKLYLSPFRTKTFNIL
jgi:hypothetical protein